MTHRHSAIADPPLFVRPTISRSTRLLGGAAALAILAVGCTADGGDGDKPFFGPAPLVSIERDGSRVEWFAPELEGDGPEVVITVEGDAALLVHPDFVDKVGSVKAYLALVDDDAPLAEPLLPFARDVDLELLEDAEARRALRDESARVIEIARAEMAQGDDSGLIAIGCSAAQADQARSAYGAAYSEGAGNPGSKTCGQSMPFHDASGDKFYCNMNPSISDCDERLGGGTENNNEPECDPDLCTTVRGRTQARRARFATSLGGTTAFANYGTRYRFAFKNCARLKSATMRRKRGGGDWIYTTIAPNSMQIRVGGGAVPAAEALVMNYVAWGAWKENRNWGTSAHPLNTVEMTSQTDGYLCGDIIQRFETYDNPVSWCNGGKHLCTGSSCTGSGTPPGCFVE